jgi:hypothetical protein
VPASSHNPPASLGVFLTLAAGASSREVHLLIDISLFVGLIQKVIPVFP